MQKSLSLLKNYAGLKQLDIEFTKNKLQPQTMNTVKYFHTLDFLKLILG